MKQTSSAAGGGIMSRAALATIGLGVQGLARFIFTVFVGNMAGKAAIADASSLLSVSVWMALVMPQPLGTAASRYFAIPELAKPAAGYLNRLFWIAAPVLSLVTIPIALWVVGDLPSALSCAVLVFTYNAYVYTRGAMMGEDRVLRATVADVVSSFVAIGALALVLFGALNWALLLPLALGFGLFALLTRPNTPREPIEVSDRKMISRFVRDAIVGGIVAGGLLQTTMLFVRVFDNEQAGIFAAALSLATPANMVAQALSQVMIPYFARLSADREAVMRAQRKMFMLTSLAFAVVFGLLIVFAPFIMSVVYVEEFAEGDLPMRVLLGLVFLNSAMTAPAAYLFATGQQRSYATIWTVSLVVGMVVMSIASPFMGMWGAILGYALGSGGGSIAVMVRANVSFGRHTLS